MVGCSISLGFSPRGFPVSSPPTCHTKVEGIHFVKSRHRPSIQLSFCLVDVVDLNALNPAARS